MRLWWVVGGGGVGSVRVVVMVVVIGMIAVCGSNDDGCVVVSDGSCGGWCRWCRGGGVW